jgi:hypothetical protein
LPFASELSYGGFHFPPISPDWLLTFAKPLFIHDLDFGFVYWMSVVIVLPLSCLTPLSGLNSTLEDELAVGLFGGIFGVSSSLF